MGKVWVKVYDRVDFRSDEPPSGLVAFLGWLNERIADIPEDMIGFAEIRIDANSGYEGCAELEFTIGYYRPMTEAEEAIEDNGKRLAAEASEAVERQQYEQLKKKFG